MNAFFLTHQEKVFWIQRLSGNKTGIVNSLWKWDQVLEAIVDPKTWLIFFFNIAINIPNGGKSVPSSGNLRNNLTIIKYRFNNLQWYNYQEPWIHLRPIITSCYANRCHVHHSFCYIFLLSR